MWRARVENSATNLSGNTLVMAQAGLRLQPMSRGLHLVRDHHMGVQMRIASTGVVVLERGRDHPGHVHLRDRTIRAGCTHRGCGNLPLDERNRLRHRRMMRLRNQCLRTRVGNGPQDAGRLRDREGVVEPCNSPPRAPSGFLGLERGDSIGAFAKAQGRPSRSSPASKTSPRR